MDEWMKKLCYRYTMKLLFSHKKGKKSYHVTTWMDLQGIMFSDISQTDKDKYHMISLICGILKKKKGKEKKSKLIDTGD